MDSPFAVLRINSDTDEGEIERAYRQRAKETHPDQGGSAREFQLVKAAYQELTSEHPSGERNGSRETVTDQHQRTKSRVEYLDYEVLSDRGWGLDDDPFERVSAEGLDTTDHGRILVQPDESLLEAAENRGFAWPYACRGGACANCAVAVVEGEMTTPINHILPQEMIDRGIRLSCNGVPTTDEMKIVYNIKHLPGLDELRLPPRPFKQAHGDD